MGYNWRAFRNMSTLEAMDAAQLGRNIARGKGYTTLFVRPLSIYLLRKHSADTGQGGDRKKEQHSTGRCERLLGGRHRRAQHDEGRDERGRRERRAPADAKLGERREAAQGDDPCGEGPRIVRYAERERVRRKQEPEEDDGIDRRDDQRPHEA